jgi:ribonuclease HII
MIIIGADESGTGAWAGPFTVCAVAIQEEQQPLLTQLGARDSKTMTDNKRRQVVDALIDTIIVGKCEFVSVAALNRVGKQETWRIAMINAITHVVKAVGRAHIVIDGSYDVGLARGLGMRGLTDVEFMPKADAKVPAVSAASIIAKTWRNDCMIELHQEFPEYGWKDNAGYGSPAHQTALDQYGKTVHHRPWKNLVGVPMRITRVVNLHVDSYDVYIGRAGNGEDGYFGNPSRLGQICDLCGKLHMNPGATIACYKIYFEHRLTTDPEFADRISQLRGKRLGCFCAPGPCHGDVIAEHLDKHPRTS